MPLLGAPRQGIGEAREATIKLWILLLEAAPLATHTDTRPFGILDLHLGSEIFHPRLRLPKKTSVLFAIGSFRPVRSRTSRRYASLTSRLASNLIAATGALDMEVVSPVRRARRQPLDGPACTHIRPRRRTASTMRNAPSAWKSSRLAWLWLDSSASAGSTGVASRLGL